MRIGHHIMLDMYGCGVGVTDDLEFIKEIMENAVIESGAEHIESIYHKYEPQGVTGIILLGESHLSVHTWPEHGYMGVDIFTCGDRVTPWSAVDYIIERVNPSKHSTVDLNRGRL